MLKARQKLGKYKIEKRIGHGGFANVYQAYDSIEGIRVALKVPHARFFKPDVLEEFKREARIAAALDHPNILAIKNAMYIDKTFVIASPLGSSTLSQRLKKRVSTNTAMSYAEQMLEAVACAHNHRVVHLDIKPENFILFPNDRLRLGDFGIAKIAMRTSLNASGSGTIGYVAPEQALGKPSYRSDVFSLGLVFFRMFSGALPEWPYEWPPPGIERIRSLVSPEFEAFVQRAIAVEERRRFPDAERMLAAFRRIRPNALRSATRKRKKRQSVVTVQDWKTVRFRQFKREFGKLLEMKAECERCQGPVAESMVNCPWCGVDRAVYDGPTTFPCQCDRCGRGMKKDWKYCAWCYGPGVQADTREYTDLRYEAKCLSRNCGRRDLMPFMRYCPWCHTKVRRSWKIPGTNDKCSHCDWGVVGEYWQYCPWCGRLRGNGVQ